MNRYMGALSILIRRGQAVSCGFGRACRRGAGGLAGLSWPMWGALMFLGLGVLCGAAAASEVQVGEQTLSVMSLVLLSVGSGATAWVFARTASASSGEAAISAFKSGHEAAVELPNSIVRIPVVVLPRPSPIGNIAMVIAGGAAMAVVGCIAIVSPSLVILATAATGISLCFAARRSVVKRGLPSFSAKWGTATVGLAVAGIFIFAVAKLVGGVLSLAPVLLLLLGAPLVGRLKLVQTLRAARIPRGVSIRMGGILAACVLVLVVLVGQDFLPAGDSAGPRGALAQNSSNETVQQQPLSAVVRPSTGSDSHTVLDTQANRPAAAGAASQTIVRAASPSFMTSSLDVNLTVLLLIVAVVAVRCLSLPGLANKLRTRIQLSRPSPGGIAAVILVGLVVAVLCDPNNARLNAPSSPTANAPAVSKNAQDRELLRDMIVQKEADLARLRAAKKSASAATSDALVPHGESLEIARLEKDLADARLRLAELDAAQQNPRTRSTNPSDVDMAEWGRPLSGTGSASH